MAELDPSCSTRRCLRWRTCPCGKQFLTDDHDRWYCEKCDPPTDDTYRPFR